ncbi:MAG: DNA-formamidopyrimidine glycosylase family protein [Solirubrobacteraceae bacterium]
MPEGDTIAWAAHRIRPVLEGRVPDQILTPHPRFGRDRWPERLGGRVVERIDTHGKHLFLHFEGNLVIHSHLGMKGVWGVYGPGRAGQPPARRPGSPDRAAPASSGWGRSRSRAWLVFVAAAFEVVEFDGPTLELLTDGRVRFDQRLAALGPDVLAAEFDADRFLRLLRADDQTRPIGDALLDQRNVAGIGNIWKAEGCWEAGIDPWRAVGEVSDSEAVAIVSGVRPRMLRSAREGPRTIGPRVYRLSGRPCRRCGVAIVARSQGDANRTTYWCPGCQG